MNIKSIFAAIIMFITNILSSVKDLYESIFNNKVDISNSTTVPEIPITDEAIPFSTNVLMCTKEEEISYNVYFEPCDSSIPYLAECLTSIGEKSDGTYRTTIAHLNGMEDYSKTAEQNELLLEKLKNGTLIKSIEKKTETITFPCNNETESDDPIYVYTITDSQMKAMGWKNYNLDQLNKCINEFNITTLPRIRHFISQCAHESGLGSWTKEFGNSTYFAMYEPNTKKGQALGNTEPGDGYKFKGAGYLQMTGRYNYQRFANYIQDPDVMQGFSYVASKYPWISAGFWWYDNNMNYMCDIGSTVEVITKNVTGGKAGLAQREGNYTLACQIFK